MKKLFTPLFLLFLVSNTVTAQLPGGMGGKGKMNIPAIAKVYGKVVDSKTKKPIEYASVAIIWYSKDSVIAGQVTKGNGR